MILNHCTCLMASHKNMENATKILTKGREEGKIAKDDKGDIMKKIVSIALISVMMLLSLVACKPRIDTKRSTESGKAMYDFSPKQSSIFVDRNGGVKSVEIEDFDEKKYSIQEFEKNLKERVKAYNKKTGKTEDVVQPSLEGAKKIPVAIDEVGVENAVAKVMLSYKSYEDFIGFTKDNNSDSTEWELKVSSISEAEANGISISGVFTETATQNQVTSVIVKGTTYFVCAVNFKTTIQFDGDIVYYSEGVSINEGAKNEAEIVGSGMHYIIFK